ncbi:hypothetical protein DNTS_024276 [Danionella cerebrum]|uniref:Uncharacterized protein n=1 Tax=Danionella cerebrum TaxID=2873325 RepID=A0A553R3B2_9TELE|nr:hypothetical protein DNTS_024276 [Danionella translucida]
MDSPQCERGRGWKSVQGRERDTDRKKRERGKEQLCESRGVIRTTDEVLEKQDGGESTLDPSLFQASLPHPDPASLKVEQNAPTHLLQNCELV